MGWLKRWQRKEEAVCAACGRPLTLSAVPLVSGADEEIVVILRGLPVLFCETEGHPRRYALADFGVYVIDAVFWQKRFPLGRPGRLAKVKCYQCGKNIHKQPVRASEVAGLLDIGDLPQFGIRIQGPVTTCPRCQCDQLWATKEIGQQVSSALVDAFKEAGLQP